MDWQSLVQIAQTKADDSRADAAPSRLAAATHQLIPPSRCGPVCAFRSRTGAHWRHASGSTSSQLLMLKSAWRKSRLQTCLYLNRGRPTRRTHSCSSSCKISLGRWLGSMRCTWPSHRRRLWLKSVGMLGKPARSSTFVRLNHTAYNWYKCIRPR